MTLDKQTSKLRGVLRILLGRFAQLDYALSATSMANNDRSHLRELVKDADKLVCESLGRDTDLKPRHYLICKYW